MHYDLHSHTLISDGTLSPTALVERAHAAGVDVLALTDHDVTDGIPEAQVAAATVGLKLVPGVEVSVTWGSQTVHIVGLGVDPATPALQAGLAGMREFRVWRAEEIGRRLAKAGIADAHAGALRYAQGALVSRTHFARFLVEAGRARDLRGVFKKFLVQGKPGYVPGQWATLEQAVGWIRAAGGQAVVAHPARYKVSATRLYAMLGEFRELGGVGIEVVSGSHTADDALRFAQIAANHGFLASRGSDYHGPENPWIDLGRLPDLPPGCTPIWADWADGGTRVVA